MLINVQITVFEDETVPTMRPIDMLQVLGGNPEKDTIGVSISASHAPPPPSPLSPPTPLMGVEDPQ